MHFRERTKMSLPSAKGKRFHWGRPLGPAARTFAELKQFEPLMQFDFNRNADRYHNTARSASVMKLWQSLDANKAYEPEKMLLEKALSNLASRRFCRERVEGMNRIGDIASSKSFSLSMVPFLYLISCQDKPALESLEMFNSLISNGAFYTRMFYFGLDIILNNETIFNRKKALECMELASCSAKFCPETVSLISKMVKKSGKDDLYWDLYYVNMLLNNKNFSPDVFASIEHVPEGGMPLHWTLELANALLKNRDFSKLWLSQYLFNDLHFISNRTANSFLNSTSETFLVLKRFLSFSRNANPERIGQLRKEIYKTEAEIEDALFGELHDFKA
jgi:hypothetical protein